MQRRQLTLAESFEEVGWTLEPDFESIRRDIPYRYIVPEQNPGAVFEAEIFERISEMKTRFWARLASYGIERSSPALQTSVHLAHHIMEGNRHPNMMVTEEARLIEEFPSGSLYSYNVEDSHSLRRQKKDFNWFFTIIYNQMERVLGPEPLRNESDMITRFQDHCRGIANRYLTHIRSCLDGFCRCPDITMFNDCLTVIESKRRKRALLAEVYIAMMHYLLLLHQQKVCELSLDIVRRQAPMVVSDQLVTQHPIIEFYDGFAREADEDITLPVPTVMHWRQEFRERANQQRLEELSEQRRLRRGVPAPEEDGIPWSIRFDNFDS